jgi:putative hydrolase of HD superfamily
LYAVDEQILRAKGIIDGMKQTMKTKASNPIHFLNQKKPSEITRFYFEITQLKHLFRQGWLLRGIPADRCESVAEHIFSMALIAMILADTCHPKLNLLKILRMVLIHDLGEIYVGDIVPGNPISGHRKHRLEKDAVKKILGKLPNKDDYLKLWEEFEQGASREAKFVRQIDKLDMALQAAVYEHQEKKSLDEFFRSAKAEISSQELQSILNELEHIRYLN